MRIAEGDEITKTRATPPVRAAAEGRPTQTSCPFRELTL